MASSMHGGAGVHGSLLHSGSGAGEATTGSSSGSSSRTSRSGGHAFSSQHALLLLACAFTAYSILHGTARVEESGRHLHTRGDLGALRQVFQRFRRHPVTSTTTRVPATAAALARRANARSSAAARRGGGTGGTGASRAHRSAAVTTTSAQMPIADGLVNRLQALNDEQAAGVQQPTTPTVHDRTERRRHRHAAVDSTVEGVGHSQGASNDVPDAVAGANPQQTENANTATLNAEGSHHANARSQQDSQAALEHATLRRSRGDYEKLGSPLGQEDGHKAEDDGSCDLVCRPHGFCRNGQCICVLAYEGPDCRTPRELPSNLHSAFEGNFLLNAEHVRKVGGIGITTNPKAGEYKHGRTHTLFAPLSADNPVYDRKFNKSGAVGLGERLMITPGLLKLLPDTDPLGGVVYESCAVVGSSGISLMYEDGPRIDSASAVIRFNSAPTKATLRSGLNPDGQPDFPKHVGARTTFRFINTQHIMFFEENEMRIQQMQSKNGLLRYLQHRARHTESSIVAFDTDFTSYVSSNIPTLPTGGYFAVWFGMQVCASLHLYGFNWRPGHAIPHHYFNSEVPLGGAAKIHDYAAESTNIRVLAKEGYVHFAQPCVVGCEAESGIKCADCGAGSACVCGSNVPTPAALPGFCHMRKNYTCMYKCPRQYEKQCIGGPSGSRCPKDFDPELLGLRCAIDSDVPKHMFDGGSSTPRWMKRGFSGHGVEATDLSEQVVKVGAERPEVHTLMDAVGDVPKKLLRRGGDVSSGVEDARMRARRRSKAEAAAAAAA
ncbi:glycosyltransferase family 29 protein [Pseudoscourfieldia marina]